MRANDITDVFASMDVNDMAAKFDAYMTRIENGRVNEPLTAYVTGQFPTLLFCAVPNGWEGNPMEHPGVDLLEDCNTDGFNLGCHDNSQLDECALLLQSDYRYLQV